MITKEKVIKIGGFGHSIDLKSSDLKIIDEIDKILLNEHNLYILPPEILKGEPHTYASDLFWYYVNFFFNFLIK